MKIVSVRKISLACWVVTVEERTGLFRRKRQREAATTNCGWSWHWLDGDPGRSWLGTHEHIEVNNAIDREQARLDVAETAAP